MPRDDALVAELCARLEPRGEVRSRRMFGGHGLYCDEVFFAVVDDGILYFRVDEDSVEAYRAAGSAPFRPMPDKPAMLGYFEVPLGVLERDEEFRAWAGRAVEAARRRAGKKAPRKKKTPRRRATEAVPVGKLLNIGPKSAAWLRAVGIETRADLERIGSVRAYQRVAEAGLETSLNLLYALEGALLELRWDRLSAAIKENLRQRARR